MHGHWVTIRNNTKSMNKDNSWYELVKCIFPVWKSNFNFESLSIRLPSPSRLIQFGIFFTISLLQTHCKSISIAAITNTAAQKD